MLSPRLRQAALLVLFINSSSTYAQPSYEHPSNLQPRRAEGLSSFQGVLIALGVLAALSCAGAACVCLIIRHHKPSDSDDYDVVPRQHLLPSASQPAFTFSSPALSLASLSTLETGLVSQVRDPTATRASHDPRAPASKPSHSGTAMSQSSTSLAPPPRVRVRYHDPRWQRAPSRGTNSPVGSLEDSFFPGMGGAAA